MNTTDADQALINLLRVDARSSVSELARRLGVSRTTIQDRIARLENRGVIAGYTVRLGADHARSGMAAYVMISIEPRHSAAIVSALKKMPAIDCLQTVSGKVDLMARATTRSPAELDQLLDRIGELEGVVKTESALVLSTKLDRGQTAV